LGQLCIGYGWRSIKCNAGHANGDIERFTGLSRPREIYEDWHPNIGDPTMADAICDRLLHNAYKIDMKGDSMRTKRPITKTDKKEVIERENKLS
jgi:hypothetical protein